MAGHSKSRTLRVYTVDSFSSVPFAGNPAAVCPLEEDISDELKQKIARELNISETAFVDIGKKKHSSSVAPTYPLRWFTPTTEVPLCGHATLATAHVLFSQNYVNGDTVSFQTMRGLLTVKKKEDGSLQMDFPQGAPSAVKIREPLQKEMIERLGLKDAAIVDVQYCAPNRKLLVHVERDETSAGSGKGNVPLITSLRPDNLLALQWDLDMDVRGIIVTTQPTLEDEERWRSFHVVSRYFAPWNGIPEVGQLYQFSTNSYLHCTELLLSMT